MKVTIKFKVNLKLVRRFLKKNFSYKFQKIYLYALYSFYFFDYNCKFIL